MRILVVDDEPEMAALLVRGLRGEGHEVIAAHDGVAALGEAGTEPIDLAVLDVMLPGMSGFELCRRIKERDETTAVILLTARDAVDDRVRGLDAGADDYMIKPFAFAELAARIRAVRRRDALTVPARIEVGTLTIDLRRHRARAGAKDLSLSRTEFDVLRVLAEHAGDTVSRAELLTEVWETSENIDSNIVDQYVSYLRRKLDLAGAGARIVTARGVGFSLTLLDPR
ncbi:MAG: two-component system response regulator [Naasia sp.]|jgi:two-component system OmpR family response regulator|uniref:response regulator transcription factor n=1 Tax=Naasia sp. TaxID=2546198 RepID=UPI002635C4A5|nr:response regulator transcription factor [Naasia sp.]MCU1570101.1 two-component system response regulator [Naasia sp.]